MLRFLILLSFALLAAPAAAQIPRDIPDGTGRDLAEEQKERRVEGHRESFQRLYLSTRMAAGPAFEAGAVTTGLHQGVGFVLGDGHVAALAVDAYLVPRPRQADARSLSFGPEVETVSLVTLQYHYALAGLAPASVHARRASLALGWGAADGGNRGMTVTLTPTYTLPVNRRWSLPLGLTVSHLVAGPAAAQRTFVGVQAGVRLHPFRDRDRLE